MGLELKRNLTGAHTLQAGEFFSDPARHVTRRMIAVTLSCPLCGGLADLDERHAIDSSGRMTPAFACASCPLLEWITLSGWGEMC